jgi:hypothetical protein
MGNNINGKLGWGSLMTKHVDEIREALTLKKKFTDDADDVIRGAVDNFLATLKNGAKKKPVIYVGIHMRSNVTFCTCIGS